MKCNKKKSYVLQKYNSICPKMLYYINGPRQVTLRNSIAFGDVSINLVKKAPIDSGYMSAAPEFN